MFRKIICLVIMMAVLTSVTWAQGKYSIKEMTPEVQQALNARKDRYNELRSLKSAGSVGEDIQGYVKLFKDDSNAAFIVNQENQDRRIIYQAIAKQNGLEGALSTIESAFAQVQSDKAIAGDKIQTEDGQWINK